MKSVAEPHAPADRALAMLALRSLSVDVGQTGDVSHDDDGSERMLVRLTAVVAFLLLAVPLAVDAQPSGQPVHTVGVLMPQNMNVYPSYAAFPETLRRLGYHEGGNLRIVLRSAEGKLDRLPTLATELVSARVDVIVAVNTPGARAAIQATKQIPIVMTEVGDPLGSGFVSNLARPGGNVTGISTMVGELTAKRLAILKEVVPSAKRLAVMFNPDDPVTVPQIRDAERAAPLLNIEIRLFPVRATANLPETFKHMLAWRADAAISRSSNPRSLTWRSISRRQKPSISRFRRRFVCRRIALLSDGDPR